MSASPTPDAVLAAALNEINGVHGITEDQITSAIAIAGMSGYPIILSHGGDAGPFDTERGKHEVGEE